MCMFTMPEKNSHKRTSCRNKNYCIPDVSQSPCRSKILQIFFFFRIVILTLFNDKTSVVKSDKY